VKRTCWNCKKPLRTWELLCSQCSMLPSSRPEYVVVISGPAFSYRLTNYLFGVLPGIAAILLARFLMGSLSSALGRLFGDIGASVGTVVAGLAMLAALLFCFASVVVGWDDVRSRAIYEVSKRGAKYSNVMGAKLYDFELALVDVISVKVVQGRVGRFFNYGELVFVTREQAEALRFAGVAEPYAVKERVDEAPRPPTYRHCRSQTQPRRQNPLLHPHRLKVSSRH
jgi:hypothetical protein